MYKIPVGILCQTNVPPRDTSGEKGLSQLLVGVCENAGRGVVTANLVPPRSDSDPGGARAGPFRLPTTDTIAL